MNTTIIKQKIVKHLNNILNQAISQNASDIHFDIFKDTALIRIRIDGTLYELQKIKKEEHIQIISRLKALSNLDISEKRLPQEGNFSLKINNKIFEFRVSTCPTTQGEKIVLRIMQAISNNIDIENLGMENWQKKLFINSLNKKQGLILITGSTGSGKTSSLYAGLNIINKTNKNILTAEDPVEIDFPKITQININTKIGLDYSNILKTFLRQDPDVIMIGEIRDKTTAEMAIKASQTGHLILSTLHTNNAKDSINRLSYLGISLYNILNSVNLIIAQKLIKKLCPNCKIKVQYNENFLVNECKLIKEEISNINFFTPTGCKKCNNGYKGRTGIFEFLEINKKSNYLYEQKSCQNFLTTILKKNTFSLKQAFLEKLKNEITSLEEGYQFF